MEDPRCMIAAAKTAGPGYSGSLDGMTVGIEDPRCSNLLPGTAAEIDDPRCGRQDFQMEDPRCAGLLGGW